VGKSLRLHPLLSLLMLLVGGAIAGIAGLMLVLPVMGVTLLLGETLELILTDIRLRARHAFSVFLRKRAAEVDLTSVP
jgi:predicted PurR-regulated permease PerM